MGRSEKYTLLKMLEFNITRKRMNVVLRCSNGRFVLYCKGKGSVIYERLAKGHDPVLKEKNKDTEVFANNGLRTLRLRTVAWTTMSICCCVSPAQKALTVNPVSLDSADILVSISV